MLPKFVTECNDIQSSATFDVSIQTNTATATATAVDACTQTDNITSLCHECHSHNSIPRTVVDMDCTPDTPTAHSLTATVSPHISAHSQQSTEHSQTTALTDSQQTACSDTTDISYEPSTDTDSDKENQATAITDEDLRTENKYLIFDTQLDKLLKFCPDCGSRLISCNKHTTGTMLTVVYACQHGHTSSWHSQPIIRKMPAGNLMASAAILLSGSTYSKIDEFFNILHTPFIGSSDFYQIQNTYLAPTISDYWTMHQTALLSVLLPDQLVLCGDARSDSPGHSAKYTSYTIMDTTTNLILDQQLMTVTETGSSVQMEKEALRRSLDFLLSTGIQIKTIATDRHPGIRALLHQEYPEINHQFDVWHVAKNVGKKLHQKALKKNASNLMPWIHSVTNHLYWSAQTCNGNSDLLREKWTSSIHHIANIHHWNGKFMTHCEHETVDDDIDWLTVDSDAHKALKNVVLDRRLLNDMDRLTDFCHTGRLESYHAMLLKYAPKRQHFSFGGMLSRLQLAALDYNYNADTETIKDSDGNEAVRQVFSKARKQWILKTIKQPQQHTHTYREDLINKILERRRDPTVRMDDSASRLSFPHVKHNIATVEKPPLSDAVAARYSRMQKLK